MQGDVNILLVTAASIGFLHTLTGPDHYLPFIVMSKARNWSNIKTLWITFLCGVGHVGSSIVIGTVGIALGMGVNRLVAVESSRGNLAAWAFILFGFGYFVWGIWKALRNKPHTHFHMHMDAAPHTHPHEHRNTMVGNHVHPHEHSLLVAENHTHSHEEVKPVNLTPWILFTVFVLGPCEPLIPLLMYPAAKMHMGAVVLVSAVFSAITILTMLVIVQLTLKGISFLPMKMFEKYMHAIAGAAIFLSGCAIVFLGL
jgi:nickel/cobalt transporter (NicO) family protein